MNGMRILGAVCASILASSLGTLAACGGSPESKEATTAQAVSAASVSIALFDENGTRVGDGSGVMIAPRLVLTSGHLIAGKHRWVVTSADGKQQATGSRGLTYDWMTYDSNRAHPRKHDVGVIHLDENINLASYPKLVGEKSANGTKVTRARSTSSGVLKVEAELGRVRSSPNAYLADFHAGEVLDTGGAVYDSRGILGIVSGRGTTTGKLYVARVDGLVKWLAPKIACAGAATGVRTYAGPAADKSQEICEDAGAGSSSSSGGDTSNGGSGGGDNGGTCDGDNDGVCSGNCGSGGTNGSNPGGDGTPGTGGAGGNAGSSGSTGTNPGGDGTPGTGGAGGNAGSSGSTGTNPGGDGTPGAGGSGGSDGSSNPGGDGTPGSSGGPGNNGSSGNNGSATPGGSSGTPSGGAGGSQGGDSDEACQGPNDNPEVCPPEPDGCVGPSCGGGQPDDSIDYGNCACGSSGEGIYLR